MLPPPLGSPRHAPRAQPRSLCSSAARLVLPELRSPRDAEASELHQENWLDEQLAGVHLPQRVRHLP